jgi:hypothetical protein
MYPYADAAELDMNEIKDVILKLPLKNHEEFL